MHLHGATNDLALEEDDRVNALREVVEAMDMRPGDDIDYPALYSRQRASSGAEDRAALLHRVRDARRVLRQIELVDEANTEIWIDDQYRLAVSLKTKTGASISEII